MKKTPSPPSPRSQQHRFVEKFNVAFAKFAKGNIFFLVAYLLLSAVVAWFLLGDSL